MALQSHRPCLKVVSKVLESFRHLLDVQYSLMITLDAIDLVDWVNAFSEHVASNIRLYSAIRSVSVPDVCRCLGKLPKQRSVVEGSWSAYVESLMKLKTG